MEYQLPQKQLGSELQTEYGWSKNIPENIFLFFFQLVRNKNINHLEKQLHQLLKQNNSVVKMYLLRILAYTRDIKYGAGEKNLAYMQLFVWFHYFQDVEKS